jgi:hypothetical protein
MSLNWLRLWIEINVLTIEVLVPKLAVTNSCNGKQTFAAVTNKEVEEKPKLEACETFLATSVFCCLVSERK